MIENQEVFGAVRRGYGDLSDTSDSEVVDAIVPVTPIGSGLAGLGLLFGLLF